MTKTYDIGINPGIGYFLADRWEIGGGPAVSIGGTRFVQSGSAGYSSKNRASSIGFNLYTRYYLKKEGRIVPYLIVGGGYSKLYNKFTNSLGSDYTTKSHQWQLSAGAGVSWFISPKFALFTELIYNRAWIDGGHSSGLDFKIGFQVFLNRKTGKAVKSHR